MGDSYLGFRSYFSLLRGCRSPEEICSFAREHGVSAVGMADINNFYGLIRFLQAARREGIKPVAGAIVERGGKELFTAYVTDRMGFSRICRVLSDILSDPEERFDPVGDMAEKGWEGLSVISRSPEVLARLGARKNGRGRPPGLYAGLRYGEPYALLVRQAREMGIPLAALADTVFFDQEDERLYPLLRAIDLNTTLENVPAGEAAGKGKLFAGPEHLFRYFSAVPDALENSRRIAEESSAEGIISPAFVFPTFEGLREEETFRRLRKLCEEGAVRRYGGMRPDIRARLDYELSVIREKGFASYFLVVRDIVLQCPRTCGRGSAASSIVSYLLGITHVDPLRYNLFFERFLNRGRKDPPDIDVDFPWDERDNTLRYVFGKYSGRSAMVANHVTFGPRSAVRDPAKALAIEEEEIGRLLRFCRLGRREELPPYLAKAAARIRGFPRNMGTHCGGVVITPEPITDYTHVQTSPLGYPVIAWEKDAAEEAGLVKIDLLGNRSLGVLRDSLALVERNHGVSLDWEGFDPLQDPETRDSIAAGKTLGVFYVESPATRQLLTKMRRGDYENLVIASSIIRPAANKYIRIFVKRLHGAPYRPLHPLIEGTLAETFGVMVYQEDVSRVAIDLAGFPIEEADGLRKVLSKKNRALRLPDFRERFFRGGAARGVSVEVLEKVWDMILSFDGYSFCKAHSASYAQVSYRLAYIKRFFPLEFIASVINNGGGFYSRQTYVDEARRMGFRILPPDVNKSGWEYTVEALPPDDAASRPSAGLRVGLGQLRDFARPLMERILAERGEGGPFLGFGDFLARVSPRAGNRTAPRAGNRTNARRAPRLGFSDLRVLIRSGALDSISEGCTRPQLFFRFHNEGGECGLGLAPPAPPLVGDYPEGVKLRDEAETLGLVISRHPLSLFRARIRRMVARYGLSPVLSSSAEIPEWKGKRVWISGILVTGKEVVTRKREQMIFVSFEDEEAVFETVLFPDAFERLSALLDQGWAFLILGRVEEDLGALAISVENLVRVSRGAEDAEEIVPSSPGRAASPRVFFWGYGETEEPRPVGEAGPLLSR